MGSPFCPANGIYNLTSDLNHRQQLVFFTYTKFFFVNGARKYAVDLAKL